MYGLKPAECFVFSRMHATAPTFRFLRPFDGAMRAFCSNLAIHISEHWYVDNEFQMEEAKNTARAIVHIGYDGRVHKYFKGCKPVSAMRTRCACSGFWKNADAALCLELWSVMMPSSIL